jgi:hypothetical protein
MIRIEIYRSRLVVGQVGIRNFTNYSHTCVKGHLGIKINL